VMAEAARPLAAICADWASNKSVPADNSIRQHMCGLSIEQVGACKV
jgi:hypothetical protein